MCLLVTSGPVILLPYNHCTFCSLATTDPVVPHLYTTARSAPFLPLSNLCPFNHPQPAAILPSFSRQPFGPRVDPAALTLSSLPACQCAQSRRWHGPVCQCATAPVSGLSHPGPWHGTVTAHSGPGRWAAGTAASESIKLALGSESRRVTDSDCQCL